LNHLKLTDIEKHYGKVRVLNQINLEIGEGQMVCLLGPSGCGKSTLLKIIAGLEMPDSGGIEFKGVNWSGLDAKKRRVGMVFQHYSLFPNLNALQNVAFGLEMKRMPRKQSQKEAEEWLERVGLQDFRNRYPHQMSGGQQQRVALARALAPSPDLLLLDEPLSALDAAVRLSLRGEIRRLQLQLGITAVFVTHDQAEALAIADRVALMREGSIVEYDDPQIMYSNPNCFFTSSFIGVVSVMEGTIASLSPPIAKVCDGMVALPYLDEKKAEIGRKIRIVMHAEDIELSEGFSENGRFDPLRGQIYNLDFLGKTKRYTIRSSDGNTLFVEVQANGHMDFQIGQTVEMVVRPENMHVFDARTEESLKSAGGRGKNMKDGLLNTG